LTPGVAVAKETKKDIVDRQEARDKASAMSSHRRILAWEKDLRTKNARQLVILAYFLVHITQQNKCVPSLPTLIHSHATGCRLNVTDTQMHRNGMPHSTDWDPRAGKEGSPGSLEA